MQEMPAILIFSLLYSFKVEVDVALPVSELGTSLERQSIIGEYR
jgi:hypothetical protein